MKFFTSIAAVAFLAAGLTACKQSNLPAMSKSNPLPSMAEQLKGNWQVAERVSAGQIQKANEQVKTVYAYDGSQFTVSTETVDGQKISNNPLPYKIVGNKGTLSDGSSFTFEMSGKDSVKITWSNGDVVRATRVATLPASTQVQAPADQPSDAGGLQSQGQIASADDTAEAP